MPRKKKKKIKKTKKSRRATVKPEIRENKKPVKKENNKETRLHPDTHKSVWAVVFIGVAVILFLASFQKAGPVGGFFYILFNDLFGLGYYLLPLVCLVIAGVFLASERRRIYQITFLGAGLFVLFFSRILLAGTDIEHGP